jgi:hypothetical protein
MSPALGTARQIHHTTGIAVTTICSYARQGLIIRVGWEPVGTQLAPTYDAHAVLRVADARAQARRDAPRRLRCTPM